MKNLLTLGLLLSIYLVSATSAFADTLIYPSPAPDSRTMFTYWTEPNICHQDTTNTITTTINGEYIYRQSSTCSSGEISGDSTAPLGSTKTSSVGQVITIPSNINLITGIYFDNVWVGNNTTVNGTNVGMNSEIRVYQGNDRTTLLKQQVANVPWGGAGATNISAVFNPPLVVTPGSNVYFELYSTDDLGRYPLN